MRDGGGNRFVFDGIAEDSVFLAGDCRNFRIADHPGLGSICAKGVSFAGKESTMQGTVKWFNGTKGYGFITPEGGGKDVFVHQRALDSTGLTSLTEADRVEFQTEPGDKGPQAKDVKKI